KMKSAFEFFGAGPSAGAGVFADLHGACAGAGAATDGAIALVVERMKGQVVLLHVLVDLAGGPVQKRRNRVTIEAVGPLDDLPIAARSRLLPANSAQPGLG